MRRSITRSVIGFVLAAAFVVARAEEATGALHCPHHDAVPGGVVAAADGPDGPAGHDAPHHGEHAAGAELGEVYPGHGADAEHGACTCMGECQSAPAVSLPTPSVAVVLLRLPQAPGRPAHDEPLPARAVAQPHTIPYATAPPPTA